LKRISATFLGSIAWFLGSQKINDNHVMMLAFMNFLLLVNIF
jgi:hypothetical protein